MATNPSLVSAWKAEADKLAQRKDDIHKQPGGTMEACRHNAGILVEHVEQAFRDAGYFPMMLLLGTIVRPALETGGECPTCLEHSRAAIISPTDGSVLGHSSMTKAEHVALYERALRRKHWKDTATNTVNVRPIGWNLNPEDAEALAHVLTEWATTERALRMAPRLHDALQQAYPPHTQDDDCLACGGNICELAEQ